jgi:hypothetical protein
MLRGICYVHLVHAGVVFVLGVCVVLYRYEREHMSDV